MIRIAVVGNCQAAPLLDLLVRFFRDIEKVVIAPVYLMKKEEQHQAFEQLSVCDVIVSQPLGAGFGPLATSNLRRYYSDKLVTFPSIHFAGMLPQLRYLRRPSGGTVLGPLGDYHDVRVLAAFMMGLDEKRAMEFLQEPIYDVSSHWSECVAESSRREKYLDVKVVPYIEDNLAKRNLLYTFNHIDNEFLLFCASEIGKLCGLKVRDEARLPEDQYLLDVVGMVPSQFVEFLSCEWRQDEYWHRGKPVPTDDLVSKFYACYRGERDLQSTAEFNVWFEELKYPSVKAVNS